MNNDKHVKKKDKLVAIKVSLFGGSNLVLTAREKDYSGVHFFYLFLEQYSNFAQFYGTWCIFHKIGFWQKIGAHFPLSAVRG